MTHAADDHHHPATTDPAEYWDGRYRSRPVVWSGRPNQALVAAVDDLDLQTGTALDLGAGEGGDARFLAERGYRVTAVDVAEVALQRTAALARQAGLAELVNTERHDLATGFPAGSFDLVTACFLASPLEFPRVRVLRQAAAAVRGGGALLVVDHAAPPPWATAGHHTERIDPADTLADLELSPGEWEVLRSTTTGRDATGPDGEPGRLLDAVLVVRRAPAV